MSATGFGEVATLAATVIDKIWPDHSEEEKQKLAAMVVLIQGQLDINKAEAANPSILVSGWRPAVGWVCVAACAWNWCGLPIMQAALLTLGYTTILSPANLSEMLPILVGLLGLGGLRTMEKINGVASS